MIAQGITTPLIHPHMITPKEAHRLLVILDLLQDSLDIMMKKDKLTMDRSSPTEQVTSEEISEVLYLKRDQQLKLRSQGS